LIEAGVHGLIPTAAPGSSTSPSTSGSVTKAVIGPPAAGCDDPHTAAMATRDVVELSRSAPGRRA
jgi:hypothetical protein